METGESTVYGMRGLAIVGRVPASCVLHRHLLLLLLLLLIRPYHTFLRQGCSAEKGEYQGRGMHNSDEGLPDEACTFAAPSSWIPGLRNSATGCTVVASSPAKGQEHTLGPLTSPGTALAALTLNALKATTFSALHAPCLQRQLLRAPIKSC